jgi:hypothetical protein
LVLTGHFPDELKLCSQVVRKEYCPDNIAWNVP